MNCHICASSGLVREAVSACQECGAAVCQVHLEESVSENRPQSLHLPGCTFALDDSDATGLTATVVKTASEAAKIVQLDSVEPMWEMRSTTDDSAPDSLTIVEAATWVSMFPSAGATTSLQVVQRSVRVLWEAAPRSSEPGSLDQLLGMAANALAGISSLEVGAVAKPQDAVGLAEAAAQLFFARGRAQADWHYDIAERLTEVLWVLNAARHR
jgi:hypothetical protein